MAVGNANLIEVRKDPGRYRRWSGGDAHDPVVHAQGKDHFRGYPVRGNDPVYRAGDMNGSAGHIGHYLCMGSKNRKEQHTENGCYKNEVSFHRITSRVP